MKSCCDEYCANYGCNQGRNCPAHTERYVSNKRVYAIIAVLLAVFWIAVLYLVLYVIGG